MKFVVAPVVQQPKFPNITMCVLCSEDPRWCPPTQ
jgi:hypothetical protein